MDKRVIAGLLAIMLVGLLGLAYYLMLGKKGSEVAPAPVSTAPIVQAPVATPEGTPAPPASVSTPLIPKALAVFKVTGAGLSVSPTNSDTCSPATNFSAAGQISANGAGTVTYRWEKSDGVIGANKTATFAAAGNQNVSLGWELAVAGSYWVKLHVLSPNDLYANQTNFSLSCPARVNSATASVKQTAGNCTTGKTTTFEGVIESNSAGDVSYTWLRSDGATGPTKTITFGSPGTQTVSTTWTIWAAYDGWQAVKTTSPNVVTSNHADFHVTCP